MFKCILAAVFATAAIATPVAATAAAAVTTTVPQAVIFHGSPTGGGTLADGAGSNVIFHG